MMLVQNSPTQRSVETEIQAFWQCISLARFDDLIDLFHEDAQIFLPNTREVFDGPGQYIAFNKVYPGRWYATLERMLPSEDLAVTITNVSNEAGTLSFFVTSYFEFKHGKIQKLEEYWGENGSPPEWRRDGSLTRVY